MTRATKTARPDFEERTESFMYWLHGHARLLGFLAGGLVLAAGALWMYSETRQRGRERAEARLMNAEQAIDAGNAALAERDLKDLISKYPGTPAAERASLRLAQMLFDKGQYQEGVVELERLSRETDDRAMRALAEDQIAAGYEEMGKFGDAAQHYLRAAENARFEAERANYRASAARAYASGGNIAEAKRVWRELLADPNGPASAEARVRLGELEAQAARAS